MDVEFHGLKEFAISDDGQHILLVLETNGEDLRIAGSVSTFERFASSTMDVTVKARKVTGDPKIQTLPHLKGLRAFQGKSGETVTLVFVLSNGFEQRYEISKDQAQQIERALRTILPH